MVGRTSDARGDVFRLVQRLELGFNFGHLRKRLREFAGLPPSFPLAERAGEGKARHQFVAERWAERKPVWPDSPTWRYLARKRRLPATIIEAASVANVLRKRPVGGTWFGRRRAVSRKAIYESLINSGRPVAGIPTHNLRNSAAEALAFAPVLQQHYRSRFPGDGRGGSSR